MTGTDYTVVAPKCACGDSITKFFSSGKPGKFCTACRDRQMGKHRIGKQHLDCAQCAKPFTSSVPSQKYCSPQCRHTARLRRDGHQPMKLIGPYKCQYCAKTFKPIGSRYSTFCTRECAFAAKAAAPSSLIYAGYCEGCRNPFVSRRQRRFCSGSCVPRAFRPPTEPIIVVCKVCSTTFLSKTFGRPKGFCSAACQEVIDKAAKRVARTARRARVRGVTVEKVDPYVVFRRDRWRCQLCGVKTPQELRGTYEDNAPELDHIITLADKGEHSYRNTHCACRRCNLRKAGRSMGQTLLFG